MFFSAKYQLRTRLKGMKRIGLRSRGISNSSEKSVFGTSKTKIHVVGGKDYDDLKQFRLVQLPTSNLEPKTLASLYVKRNIAFGSRIHVGDGSLVKNCLPLMRRALAEAGVEGGEYIDIMKY
jgi:hypothetical protein